MDINEFNLFIPLLKIQIPKTEKLIRPPYIPDPDQGQQRRKSHLITSSGEKEIPQKAMFGKKHVRRTEDSSTQPCPGNTTHMAGG